MTKKPLNITYLLYQQIVCDIEEVNINYLLYQQIVCDIEEVNINDLYQQIVFDKSILLIYISRLCI